MSNRPGTARRPDPTDDVDRHSPWPVLVAAGLALSEVGVLFGVVALATGGILLFGGSCAALLHEAGYATTRWHGGTATGGVLAVAGGGVWIARLQSWTASAVARSVSVDPLAFRSAVVCSAAGMLLLVGLAGVVWTATGTGQSG